MVAIIGSGNVATHLYKALKDHTEVKLVNPHIPEDLPADADFILICVKDNVIAEVSGKIPASDSIIAHCSGSIPLDILKKSHKNCGVLYPLQTFSKDMELKYSEIPVFIEGSSKGVAEKLHDLASNFSGNILEADSEKRKLIHLSSVFACNFTNAMIGIADNILASAGLPKSVLQPLLRQTFHKLEKLTPQEAQTGPAARKDSKVMEEHQRMLGDRKKLCQLYTLMSDIIIQQQNKGE